ncbi:MAG: hypothetical protein AB7O65_13180, partial [Candidatus Korobacteraceae bacterium]
EVVPLDTLNSFDQKCVDLLSRLVFWSATETTSAQNPVHELTMFSPGQRQHFLEIANSHHVVVRALSVLEQQAILQNKNELGAWAEAVLNTERLRIERGLAWLDRVVGAFAESSAQVTTIKTLDHWPDFGSDMDLYTTASESALMRIFTQKLKARPEPRSWGDRLARKWNFALPGLPELVEIHSQRLGQTGEQTLVAKRFLSRRTFKDLDGRSFPVPAPEERVLVATLQRMYRHFYFRLSDILNTAALVDSGSLDFTELRRAANLGGIWPGTSAYLKIVSDYVARYRGVPLALPEEVREAASFGGEKLEVRKCFLRVPIVPEGASLYARQMRQTALSGNLPAALRLSLLPPLASIAALSYRLTGSDKGIW